jgi:gamma-glutamylcyclotransferase (GGCT)/AIG2-like uncharacterized protein YtfP
MLYFAYASNLDPEQMKRRAPGSAVVGLAELRDHRVAFTQYSSTWGGGVASIQPAHGESVWGVLFEVTDEDLASLDGYENFKGAGNQHNSYEREHVWVELTRPDDGSLPRRLRAWVYIAKTWNPSPPSVRYRDAIVRGARHHRLPDDYVERLAAVATAPEEPAAGA